MGIKKDALAVFAVSYAAKLIVNLTTPYLLLLDSWVLFHVLDAVANGYGVLPRGLSYFYYPVSYVPFVPFAKAFGALFTLKFIYPLFTSLAVIPAYGLLSLYSNDRKKNALLALSIVFIDDFFIRSAGATPHGLALVFFFSSLYFLASKKPITFLLSASLTAMTHGLTSLVLGAFVVGHYMSVSGRKERVDYSYALFFPVLGAYWTLSNVLSGRGLLFLYTFLKFAPALLGSFLLHTGFRRAKLISRLSEIDEGKLRIYVFLVSALSFLFVLYYSSHSFISHHGLLSAILVPSYLILPALLLPPLLREKDIWLFSFILLAAWFAGSVLLRLNCAFDAFRLLPFALVPLLVSSLRKPLRTSFIILAIMALTLVSHVIAVYPSLAYTGKEYEAALWLKGNTEPGTIATDTRLSAIFLGVGRRSASFEGTYWLFAQPDLKDFIYTFNKHDPKYKEYPIRYVALPYYALTSGADISWNSEDYKADEGIIGRLDGIGNKIFDNGEVGMWKVDEEKVKGGKEVYVKSGRDIMDKLLSGLFGREENGGYDPGDVYGTRC